MIMCLLFRRESIFQHLSDSFKRENFGLIQTWGSRYLNSWDTLVNRHDEIIGFWISVPFNLWPGEDQYYDDDQYHDGDGANVNGDQPVDHVDCIDSCSRSSKCARTWPEHL